MDGDAAGKADDVRRRVFVVHGRNLAARDAVQAYLAGLGLVPMAFPKASLGTGKASPYLGEGLERAFQNAHATVVVMTPDDLVELAPAFLSDSDPETERGGWGQPRPNVLLEAGMALALHKDRTFFVQIGKMRTMSDLDGRLVVRMNEGVRERREQLRERLIDVGCAVAPGADCTQGDFAGALAASTDAAITGPAVAVSVVSTTPVTTLDSSQQAREAWLEAASSRLLGTLHPVSDALMSFVMGPLRETRTQDGFKAEVKAYLDAVAPVLVTAAMRDLVRSQEASVQLRVLNTKDRPLRQVELVLELPTGVDAAFRPDDLFVDWPVVPKAYGTSHGFGDAAVILRASAAYQPPPRLGRVRGGVNGREVVFEPFNVNARRPHDLPTVHVLIPSGTAMDSLQLRWSAGADDVAGLRFGVVDIPLAHASKTILDLLPIAR